MKRFLVVGFIVLVVGKAFAQAPNCSQTLRLATSTYEQGRLHELPGLLDGCLKSGFTSEQKVQAYKLLTLAYIYLEEPEKADASMLLLLQINNEFQINEAIDPAEFIALYRTFRTTPLYRIGGKGGANIAQPNVASSDNTNDGGSKYKYRLGISAGIAAEIPIRMLKLKNLTLNPELYFQIVSFNYTNQDTVHSAFGPRTQNWISLPISLQYKFGKSKFNPYVALGVETSYLLSSKSTGQSTIKSNTGGEQKSFDVTPNSNRLNFFGVASVGAKYKIGKGMVVAELRYHQGLRNVTRVNGTYANPFLTWDYHTADAIYKLNYLTLTVGYLVNIYNPKKLTIKK
jgi:hypothetical protein